MDFVEDNDEDYQDPYDVPDKDELQTMPSLQQETVSPKPLRKILGMPKLSFSKQRLEDINFRCDRLREKWDIRNKPNSELSTYQRVHARSVAKMETEYLDRMLPEVRIQRAFRHMFSDV